MIVNRNPIRVCLDARVALTNRRGWGRYAAALAEALAKRTDVAPVILLPDSAAAREFQHSVSDQENLKLVFTPYCPASPDEFYTCEGTDPPEHFVGEVDLVHSLTRFVHHTDIPVRVTSIHDIVPLSKTPFKTVYGEVTRQALKQIKATGQNVIASSRFTRTEIEEEGTLADIPITVIHLGAADCFHVSDQAKTGDATCSDGTTKPTRLLYVGGAGPNKNLERLFAAIKIVAKKMPIELVLSGDEQWGYDKFRELKADPSLFKYVHYLTDSDLSPLYRNSCALVMPSLHEGFGLPIVEGLVAGTPVICSDIAPFRETAGNFATYFDPEHVSSIVRAITSFAADKVNIREQSIATAHQISSYFRWCRVADETVQVYKSALQKKADLAFPGDRKHGPGT